MKGSGIGRFMTVMAILVVVLFGLSVLAPLSNSPLASSAASSSPAAAAPAASSANTPAAAASAAAPTTSAHAAAGSGPHPGALQVYEVAPGGAPTVDPAVAYYTVDDEVISNVYETLISFNGTDTGPTPPNWVPEIATCVPGSVQCSAETGSSLVFDNATTGLPQYYTFEISAGAKFYDPATKVSWNVYPSDVLFSFARTLQYAILPGVGYNNGWIQAQYLLPPGNPSWDGGIHGAFNNTPAPVLSSILVNDTAYCPNPSGNLPINGCVTFNVGASGVPWPYFLEMVSDPLGGSITPCGTFTYLGANLPGFYGTNAPKGDGPCLLPGNTTSSTSAAYKNYISTVSPTLWDSIQEVEESAPASPQPAVQYTMVGSGPYYEVAVSASGGPGGSGGYTLAADPTYTAPAGCAGQPNCLPAAGDYIPSVVVYWDNDDTLGLQEAIAGQADGFGFDPSDTSTVISLVKSGTYGLVQNVTSGNNWNMMFELNFNVTNENAIDPNPGTLNVPGDFLANNGLRQFLVHAYPYTTVQSTINTVDGVTFGDNYGGAIVPAQAFYYPLNVSWPGCGGLATCSAAVGNPQTNPAVAGGAASWWQNITTKTSPFYDPELASCTASTPCQFPIQGWVGTPTLDAMIAAWIASVKTLTGGAIVMYSFDITGSELYAQAGLGNGAGSLPVFNWGWVPDYADPTDYFVPFWLPNGTFSYAGAEYSTFAQSAYQNVGACGHNDYSSFSTLAYWANQASVNGGPGYILTECQGIAYQTLVTWSALAAHESNITFRVLEYDMLEQIGNLLALEVYDYSQVDSFTYGTWLAPSGINMNPSVGGGAVQTWYTWAYATSVFTVSLHETGLPASTSWSATLRGSTVTSTTPYVNFTGVQNGSYPYSVTFVGGYTASPASGLATVNGANDTVTVTFAAFVGATYTLAFTEGGLVSNTTWTMVVDNVGALSSQQPTISFALNVTSAMWSYDPGTVIGYTNTGPNSTAFTADTNVTVIYTGVILTTYSITFAASGLPPSDSWSVDLGGFTLTSTAANITFYEENGQFRFVLTVPAGLTPPAGNGLASVVGANVVVGVPLTTAANGFSQAFDESGLPTGTAWTVTLNGFGIQTNGTSLAYQLPNGTYNWTVSTAPGWIATTLSGTVLVNGTLNTAAVKIKFVAFTYAVTFFEGGLASGASWTVTVAGTPYTSTTYFVTVDLPNGTAAWSVTAVVGYLATPTSGNVTVTAAPQTQVIIFGPIPSTYTVTFTATGLPTGSTWEVFFGSQTPVSGTATSVSFTTTNGTWTYHISAPSGSAATPSGGTVTVSGGNKTVTVAFAPTGSGSTTTNQNFLGTLAYALIGLFIVLAVIFLALALYWRGRKPPAAAPPQSWESTSEKPAETESTEGSTPPTS